MTPGWFATYGMPIVDGRGLEPGDAAGAPPVAVVNEAFVRAFDRGVAAVGP